MKLLGDALCNLLLNSAVSFGWGLCVALFVLALLKPRSHWLNIVVLLLPFAKLIWDLRWGIPHASFFWISEQGVRQRLGSFQIGVGVTRLGPSLQGRLWALHGSGRSPQSPGDLLCRVLWFRVWSGAAALLGFSVLAVSLTKLVTRCAQLWQLRRTLELDPSRALVELRRVGWRSARVYSTPRYTGAPFVGGLFRPYIVLPAALEAKLSSAEREAIVQHELSHARTLDLAILLPCELLCALFWYVPGARYAWSRLSTVLEQRADEAATLAGLPRATVVNALLAAAEMSVNERVRPALAMSRGGSALRARLRHLLTDAPAKSERRAFAVARVLATAWLVLGALQAVACGNHP
jgi:hypothetical protein